MSYYDNNASWNNPPRPGWENRAIQMNQMKPEDPTAFSSQLDEVDRAVDNLVKSGKLYPQRRDSMPLMGPRGFPQEHGRNRTPSVHNNALDQQAHQEPRLAQGVPARHFPAQDYDVAARPHSATALQNFYANQRFQSPARPVETEAMVQAKRRLAAQRERELRNYHQEQQYNRTAVLADMSNMHVGKDRVVSPGGLIDEERRELVSGRYRNLYGIDVSKAKHAVLEDQHPGRVNLANGNTVPGSASGTRGPSPLSFDPFGLSGSQNGNGNLEGNHDNHVGGANTTSNSPEHSRTNSVQPQSSRTSASSPSGISHHGTISRVSTTPLASGGVAPIGTRPIGGQIQNPALNKRSTTPLPSPLGYNYMNGNGNGNGMSSGNNNEDPFTNMPNERSGSSASNTSGANGNDMWSKGVWGSNKNSMSKVGSVWG